jgi:outer membrane protein TolC
MKLKVMMILAVFSVVIQAYGQTLSLETYKQQVLEKDPATQAALERKKGAELSQDSADLLTGVSLFANSAYVDDQRPTSNPTFQGVKTKVNTYSIGLQQQTRLGFKWSLSQNINQTEINGASPAFVPLPKYYDVFPKLELTMPLWRNLLGNETSGDVDQLKFQARASAKQAMIGWIQRQSDVEEAFYRVLSQQESYEIQKDSLNRAEKILSWTDTRVKRNLVDASDLYQAQAAVASRKIDLVNAETQLREVSRTFNSLRGVVGEEVPEKLIGPNLDLTKLKIEKKAAKIRMDTLAQKELNQSSEAAYRSQREKNKPSLDLTLQAYTQGRDAQMAPAEKETFKDKDYLYVGVNFVLPLDQVTASHSRSGFASLEKSQQLLEQARLRDEKLTWEETADQADSLAKQVTLLRELEILQKKKADAERERLNRGRSTTFQVLSFEQEYNAIRSQRIQTEFQARHFINTLALFE